MCAQRADSIVMRSMSDHKQSIAIAVPITIVLQLRYPYARRPGGQVRDLHQENTEFGEKKCLHGGKLAQVILRV